MKQSIGKMIAKITVGAIFVATACTMEEAMEVAVGLVMGAGLIAWGLIPYIVMKKRQKEERQAQLAAQQQAEEIRRQAQEMRSNQPRFCEHCGATTKGTVCEYCGMPLE